MQSQPTAGGEVSSGTVRGLGVTDALLLELEAVQLPWLIDEVDELCSVYEDELRHAADPCPNQAKSVDTEALDLARHRLHTLRMMRAQLPARDHRGRMTFVGPTPLVLDIVSGTMRNVVAALSELTHGRSTSEPEWRLHVHDTSAAASAWVRTFLDCRAVEFFTFGSHSIVSPPST
jgi:hypothetical protein